MRGVFRFFLIVLGCIILAVSSMSAPAMAAPDLPRDSGLPLIVQAGASFLKLEGFDENAGTFRATVDIRLRWTDKRLAKTGAAASSPPETLRDSAAEERMKAIWVPPVVLANQSGEAALSDYGLRIYPSGRVELLHRVTADFSVDVDVARFPFDRQRLTINMAVAGLTVAEVALRFDQSDIDYSRPSANAELPGWSIGLVDLRSIPQPGWYNSTHAQVIASLDVTRQPGVVVASIFIPLFASLLIPLLAIWLNHMEDGVFQVDTHEMVNIIIGGLFAVIALNFTVYSTYVVLSSGDNTVNRLFALNYLTLAPALFINILFARFNLVSRMFGPYVQEQAYMVLMWAVPSLILILATSFMLVAYV
ncbi:hypothetical protein [Rhizobium sp. Leaf453]|uniref:hypothetical protein n=1 Tax=Rhizobium sp. Leaf453 TaxID=1736380 RepID=UPI0007146ECE|nr:hypothetical protein [Rhizobium sp. Leaf453]KQT95144.1 hypothetical protein ASG68_14150 [Rhizobium sp. Leaf453]